MECSDNGSTGPQQPGGKKGFEIDRLDFECDGRFNNQTGFTCSGYFIDAGEPQGKKGNDRDFISVMIADSGGNPVAKCEGDFEGGNIQIHPPVGKP